MSENLCHQNCEGCSTNDSSWLNVGYIQFSATASLKAIPEEGIRALDIVVFGFADFHTDKISHFEDIQDIINKEKPGTLNLLSIGGETVASIPSPMQAVKNICSQIEAYNAELKNGKFSGVDLDIEHGIRKSTINLLAEGFKKAGYIVSAAPQIYTERGDIDVKNPSNLIFTSGGPQNPYGEVIEKGYIDYIFAQTYNTGGFKVGGYEEHQLEFFYAVAEALNNVAVKEGRIHESTKIIIGEPANQGAGGTFTIFNPSGEERPPLRPYVHKALLDKLRKYIDSIKESKKQPGSKFERISGVMMWSSNNDYMPNAEPWKDYLAIVGGFSKYIFDSDKKD